MGEAVIAANSNQHCQSGRCFKKVVDGTQLGNPVSIHAPAVTTICQRFEKRRLQIPNEAILPAHVSLSSYFHVKLREESRPGRSRISIGNVPLFGVRKLHHTHSATGPDTVNVNFGHFPRIITRSSPLDTNTLLLDEQICYFWPGPNYQKVYVDVCNMWRCPRTKRFRNRNACAGVPSAFAAADIYQLGLRAIAGTLGREILHQIQVLTSVHQLTMFNTDG